MKWARRHDKLANLYVVHNKAVYYNWLNDITFVLVRCYNYSMQYFIKQYLRACNYYKLIL